MRIIIDVDSNFTKEDIKNFTKAIGIHDMLINRITFEDTDKIRNTKEE